MYIEQLARKKTSLLIYLPLPLCFFALIIFNYISSQGVDSEVLIHNIIEKIGVNAAFVLLVGPLSALCLGLLFWVKYAHQQSIKSLTTSRNKVDWKRIFFSFFIFARAIGICTL